MIDSSAECARCHSMVLVRYGDEWDDGDVCDECLRAELAAFKASSAKHAELLARELRVTNHELAAVKAERDALREACKPIHASCRGCKCMAALNAALERAENGGGG